MKSLVVLICIVMLFGGASLMGDGSDGGLVPEEDPWEDGSDGFDFDLTDTSGFNTSESPGEFDLLRFIPGLKDLDLSPIIQDQLKSTLNPKLNSP